MTRQIISLNDNQWQFGQVSRKSFEQPNVYDLSDVPEWLPATVPGNVRTNLLALGRISDPFVDENYKESLWVEESDWWYRRALQLDSPPPNQQAYLIFEGIDYLSAIFINGQEVSRHEGMFSHQIINLEDHLTGGPIEIGVRIWGSEALPTRQLTLPQQVWQGVVGPLQGGWIGVYPDRSATLKCQMSFGWDFAPPIRTMGIWDEVTLVTSQSIFLEDVQAKSTVHLPINDLPLQTAAQATVSLGVTINSLVAQTITFVASVVPVNFTDSGFDLYHFRRDIPAGQSQQQLAFDLPEVQLWQPWDRGFPHLYNIVLRVVGSNFDVLDEHQLRTGFRTVSFNQWQISINGAREFIRGVNWVPADSFPGRLRPADYKRLLGLIQQSSSNLLRVWGGGLREKQAFYDLCDELGLLVWQEFPFACMFLGSIPRNKNFLALVEQECEAMVRQIKHHPSLIIWCGGNEFGQRRNQAVINTLATIVTEYDGTRPFIAVSPSTSSYGKDTHNWHVWHGNLALQSYQQETANFLSEFGLQALPAHETLTKMLADPGKKWDTHHADVEKIERYRQIFQLQQTTSDLPSIINHSQRAQARGLQIAIERMRRQKGHAGGVCLWQFNEPWPAISWAIVDYFGRPKLAYHHLADWYNPVLISLNFPMGRPWQSGDTFEAEIWAINDTLTNFESLSLDIFTDGINVYTNKLGLPANCANQVDSLSHIFKTTPQQILVRLTHNEDILAQNSYDLTWRDHDQATLYQKFRRWVADLSLGH